MLSTEEFFKHPGWEEITRQIKYQISEAQRPADEIILDDVDLCRMLKVSKRTTATLRSELQITFYKCGGKILYKLSDILDYINLNKVSAASNLKSRIK